MSPATKFFTAVTLGFLLAIAASDCIAISPRTCGDFDGNADVNAADLALWELLYGSSNPGADGDGSGFVDGGDFLCWQRDYDTIPMVGVVRAVPEPSSLLLAGFALAVGGFQSRFRRLGSQG